MVLTLDRHNRDEELAGENVRDGRRDSTTASINREQ